MAKRASTALIAATSSRSITRCNWRTDCETIEITPMEASVPMSSTARKPETSFVRMVSFIEGVYWIGHEAWSRGACDRELWGKECGGSEGAVHVEQHDELPAAAGRLRH